MWTGGIPKYERAVMFVHAEEELGPQGWIPGKQAVKDSANS